MRKQKSDEKTKQEDEIRKIIGKRIKTLREDQKPKVTQEQLADILDVSRSHIGNLEAGQVSPSLSLLSDICLYFNCSYDFLMGKINTIYHTNESTDNIFDIVRKHKNIRFDEYEVPEMKKEKVISAIKYAISILRLNE